MKNIKIFCSWDLAFDLYHEKQIELYVDTLPSNVVPADTIRIILLIEVQDILNLNEPVMQGAQRNFFNFVLTHNDFLLQNCNVAHMFEFGTTWIKNYSFSEKEFSVSALVGGKLYAEGHYLRQKVWFKENRIKKIPTKFFLSGNLGGVENYNNNPILGSDKLPLFNSQFHICIENTQRKNWFTEKLIDCLQTKTIPVYYGCPNIGDWFNINGFIIVSNLEDIITNCNNLTENTYKEKLPFLEENFEKSKRLATIDDRLKKIITELIKK